MDCRVKPGNDEKEAPVMPGFMPGIHVLFDPQQQDADGRDKPGHDGELRLPVAVRAAAA